MRYFFILAMVSAGVVTLYFSPQLPRGAQLSEVVETSNEISSATIQDPAQLQTLANQMAVLTERLIYLEGKIDQFQQKKPESGLPEAVSDATNEHEMRSLLGISDDVSLGQLKPEPSPTWQVEANLESSFSGSPLIDAAEITSLYCDDRQCDVTIDFVEPEQAVSMEADLLNWLTNGNKGCDIALYPPEIAESQLNPARSASVSCGV